MRTLIRAARVFDGERTTPRADVLIDGELIAEYDGQPVDVEVDGAGKTLLPGLIDAHTHVFDGNLEQALGFGVTTELDMFCLPGNLARQRKLVAERNDVADLRSAGVLATAPGGHPSQLMAALPESDAVGPFDTVANVEQAKAFVDARVADGADYLKVVIDDGEIQGADLPVLGPEVVAALVEAAHGAGLKVIAHALTAGEVEIALDAGVDGLAHVWVDGELGLVERVRRQGVFVVSTLVYLEVTGVEGGARTARALHEAGVPLLAGTDATPFAPFHGESMHRELELLVQAGLTNEQALAAATSVPAHHFALPDRGRIHPGLQADLLLAEGDPTTDITTTRSIESVWRRGTKLPR
ncbi:amidohydrolase family protein [Kribbella sp. NPDC050124]|uniref:amidohydrolase family protein n=1 Tax=Kribbella sp. NPDC050124 TaxID=3364114 RepID=UPI0037BB0B96